MLGTVGYTFCFGVCMYLTMRVAGTIWAAIVLHGITDPATFLSTGGIDAGVSGSGGAGAVVAGLATVVFMAFAVVAVFLVRGRAHDGLRATT